MSIIRNSVIPLMSMMVFIPLLTGCSGNNEDTGPTGEPADFSQVNSRETSEAIKKTLGDSPDDFVNKAIRTEDGSLLVILYGSSSCPLEPEKIEVTDEDVLSVTVKPFKEDACTADIGPNNGYKVDSIPEDEVIKSGQVVYPDDRLGALNVYAQNAPMPEETTETKPASEETKK